MQLPGIDEDILSRWRAAGEGREQQFTSASTLFGWLLALNADLRRPTGCPWDREQSLASLRQYIREEADEVCTAIDSILSHEAELRSMAGMPPAAPDSPDPQDGARTPKKGHSIAHHPHRSDFDSAASASGAPLPELDDQQRKGLDSLYSELREEMGDLALQVTFLSELLHGMGRAGAEDALLQVIKKLIRRHPHVYGEAVAKNSAEVLARWEQIKLAEKLK